MPRLSQSLTMALCIVVVGTGVSETFADEKTWIGPDGGSFKQNPNWIGNKPESLDTGIHQTDTEIFFDETSSWFDPYDFAFYQAQSTPTTFTMGKAWGGDSNALRLKGGLADRSGFVNESNIKVGSFDFFWVGNPLLTGPPAEGDASGYEWTLTGPSAWVGVTGTVGAGKWTINRGLLAIGYHVKDSVSGPLFGEAIDNAAGTIDSGVLTFGDVRDSEWTIGEVQLKAQTIRNLDHWQIMSIAVLPPTLVEATEFFEVRTMSFDGQDLPKQDMMQAGWQNNDLPAINGLRVLEDLEMFTSNRIAYLGPWARVSELVVSKNPSDADAPEAVLSIRHGAQVFVLSNAFPTRVANPEFQLASTLLYGIPPERRLNLPPHDPFFRTAFQVNNGENDPGVLTFRDQSYITAIGDNRGDEPPPAPGELRITHGKEVQDMVLELVGTSLAIESSVAKLPARDWYTGDVHLAIPRNSTNVKLEAIAPDSCNLWFTDLPEPRCVKYWRSITIGGGVNVEVVDECANYSPDEKVQDCPCGANCVKNDKALYVVQSVFSLGTGSVLDLTNGIQLYYGEDDFTGNGIQLAFTEYGDFDVSCGVDITDYTSLPFNSKTYYQHILGPDVQTDWPVSDYDGDCNIDLVDFMAFQVAFGKGGIDDCLERQEGQAGRAGTCTHSQRQQ